MTLIVRYLCSPTPCDLGAVGPCRVGFAEVVGVWGSGRVVRVMVLDAWEGVAA